MNTAYIIASGICLPERIVTNEELGPKLGMEPDRVFQMTGIRSRRWVDNSWKTSDLAAIALREAIYSVGMELREIDYLIVGTMTPDRYIPGCSTVIQRTLGLGKIPCLDIRAACCNPLYALQIAQALIAAGTAKRIALAFADIQSPFLNLSANSAATSILFGDGGSALIVSSDSQDGAIQINDIYLASDGEYVDALGVRGFGTEFGYLDQRDEMTEPHMKGLVVIANASRCLTDACTHVLDRNNLVVDDIAWIVPHQANMNLLKLLAEGVGFSLERLVSVLETTGNTSSASLGLALNYLTKDNSLRAGEKLLLPAFGAGFTWGAGLCTVI